MLLSSEIAPPNTTSVIDQVKSRHYAGIEFPPLSLAVAVIALPPFNVSAEFEPLKFTIAVGS